MEHCPVFNEHIPLIVEMRRQLVIAARSKPGVQDMLTSLTRYGNSFGQSPRQRAKWTQDLGFKIKDARKEPVEYLWFVGDYAVLRPAGAGGHAGGGPGVPPVPASTSGSCTRPSRTQATTCAAWVRRASSRCCGTRTWRPSARPSSTSIVTTDPHTYHALKHEYRPRTAGGALHRGPGRS